MTDALRGAAGSAITSGRGMRVTLSSAWRAVWPQLQVLTAGSAITGVAGMVALALAGYAVIAGVAAAGLCWMTFAPLARWCVRTALVQQPGWRDYLTEYRWWRRDLLAAAAIVVPAACAALAGTWWNAGAGGWWLVSAGAGIAGAVLGGCYAAVAAVTDFGSEPIAASARRTVALMPRLVVVVAGSAVLAAIGVIGAATWSASVLVLVAGPVAVCLAGGSWETLSGNASQQAAAERPAPERPSPGSPEPGRPAPQSTPPAGAAPPHRPRVPRAANNPGGHR